MNIQMQKNDRSIFISVASGLLLSFAFLCLAIYYIQQNNIKGELHANSQRFVKVLQHEVDDEASRMHLLSSTYLLESSLQKEALQQKNRKRLLQLSQQKFAQLRQNFGITHMYFHDIQGINILRVHQPSRFGDQIKRTTLRNAAKQGTSSYGYELGPLGTLTLRVVTPWYDGIGLLGYIELGKELQLIIKNIAENEGMEIFIAVDKARLNQKTFEAQKNSQGLPSHWHDYHQDVIINEQHKQPQNIQLAIDELEHSNRETTKIVAVGERYYSIASLPLIDASNASVGHFYIMSDISSEVLSNHKILTIISILGLILTIVFLLFFKYQLNISRKNSNMLLQSIHCMGEAILITNQYGVIEYINPAFTTLTGYDHNSLIDHQLSKDYDNTKHSFYHVMWSCINTKKGWQGRTLNTKKDGNIYPAHITITPIYEHQKNTHESPKISHFIGIQADLSDMESLEEQFQQSQKLEAIGTLVGGIAHDFNNMLAGITGNLHLAKLTSNDNPKLDLRLNNIDELSQRAANMIQQLLTFARKDKVQIKPIALTSFMKKTLQLLESSLPKKVKIEQHLCAEQIYINGDDTQLHQIFMNLFNNARDAVEHQQQPYININMSVAGTKAPIIQKHAPHTDECFIHISIEDNGYGIASDKLEQLFDPFFTTKEQGKGTGLGLSMVFGAIKTHHGFVDVESVEGKGSTFHVYLPILEKTDTSTEICLQSISLAHGSGEVILLVDDEEHIIETGKVVLESLGYQVLTANDGDQAVRMFNTYSDAIELCILDVVMPSMGGDEVAKQIRDIRHDIKIIFSTGYDKHLLNNFEHETIISKPFMVDKFSQLVKDTLAS